MNPSTIKLAILRVLSGSPEAGRDITSLRKEVEVAHVRGQIGDQQWQSVFDDMLDNRRGNALVTCTGQSPLDKEDLYTLTDAGAALV